MRIVAWNCNMALERKVEVLLDLAPDIAIVCECAEAERVRLGSPSAWMQGEPVWIGRNPHKGLAVFTFNGYTARLAGPYHSLLHYIAPVHIGGPAECNLLAVWAQNASAGGIRKRQLGPLRRALSRYKGFLGERPAVIAGDLNSNTIWDRVLRFIYLKGLQGVSAEVGALAQSTIKIRQAGFGECVDTHESMLRQLGRLRAAASGAGRSACSRVANSSGRSCAADS